MNYHFFKIPVNDDGQEAARFNRFLAQHRTSKIDKEFVTDGADSFWAISVVTVSEQVQSDTAKTYKSRIDYKDVLSVEDFALYARLRELRKQLAHQEGIPAYAIFSNEQMAKMVQGKIRNKTELAELDGVGAARLEKYADAFLECLNENDVERSQSVNHNEASASYTATDRSTR